MDTVGRILAVCAVAFAVTVLSSTPAVAGPPGCQFSIAGVTVSESVGTANVPVTLAGEECEGGSVTYTTSPGSATAPSDYTHTTAVLPFGGPGTEQAMVPITPDQISEPTETFTVSLSTPTGGEVSPTNGSATVTINDDDPAPITTTTTTTTTTTVPGVITTTVLCSPGITVSETTFGTDGGPAEVAACAPFGPGTPGTIYVLSEPILIGEGTADADGVIRATVTIPSGLAPGPHTLEVRGRDPVALPRRISVPVQVVATRVRSAALAATGGTDEPGTIQLAAVIGVAGLALVAAERARRPS